MPVINVVQAFVLTKNDGTQQKFGVGQHDVPDDVAKHWYVIAHTDKAPPVEPPPGTPAYAMEMQRRAARDRLIAAAVEQQAHEAAAKVRTRPRLDPDKKEEITGESTTGATSNAQEGSSAPVAGAPDPTDKSADDNKGKGKK